MNLELTFEVEVIVTPKGQHRAGRMDNGVGLPSLSRGVGVRYTKDDYVFLTEKRMFHIPAKSHDQALERGKKYGRPLSARKFHREIVKGDIEHMKLDQKPYGADNVFKNAMAMDELIWLKKAKRSERIEENKKEKALDK
jgi:hypothetical protein